MTKEQAIEKVRLLYAFRLDILEKDAGIPLTTLSRVLKGERKLNDRHKDRLIEALKKQGYIK